MKQLLLCTVLLIGLVACSDDNEDILTEGELNARQLNEIIDGRDIGLMWVTWTEAGNLNSARFENPDYAIEGSFLRIDINYFNLAKLKRITDWGSGRIDLDFE